MIITTIKKAGTDGVSLSFDTGDRLAISLDDFIALEILKGEVTKELFTEIKSASESFSAYRAALRSLAYGQCSKKKLYEKLRAKGFSHSAAEGAVATACQKGYIDEAGQIESYLRELCERRLFGRRKAFAYLVARGYEGKKVTEIIKCRYTDGDFEGFRAEFLKKKFGSATPRDVSEALEMKKALHKQGYTATPFI